MKSNGVFYAINGDEVERITDNVSFEPINEEDKEQINEEDKEQINEVFYNLTPGNNFTKAVVFEVSLDIGLDAFDRLMTKPVMSEIILQLKEPLNTSKIKQWIKEQNCSALEDDKEDLEKMFRTAFNFHKPIYGPFPVKSNYIDLIRYKSYLIPSSENPEFYDTLFVHRKDLEEFTNLAAQHQVKIDDSKNVSIVIKDPE